MGRRRKKQTASDYGKSRIDGLKRVHATYEGVILCGYDLKGRDLVPAQAGEEVTCPDCLRLLSEA